MVYGVYVYIYIYNIYIYIHTHTILIIRRSIPQSFPAPKHTARQGIAQPAAYDFPDAPFISLGEEPKGSGLAMWRGIPVGATPMAGRFQDIDLG